ncbi:MAG: carboxylating nicotinate-nucleotide diphosphorylase [Bacteroidia bacterium]
MYSFELNKEIAHFLAEDIGNGDHTTLATIPSDAIGKAQLLIKENGIIAGVELAEKIFKYLDPNFKISVFINDGAKINKGDIAFEVEGNIQKILQAERLVLNCMQRMSGIATYTHYLNSKLQGLHTKLLDTRKTTPGFRFFEKWAVKIGGGENHRFGLYDMILIKDNHIDFSGGIKPAIQKTKSYLKENNLNLKIEVEARTIQDVIEILDEGGIHRIMLDNFTPEKLKEAINLINKKYETEASGGITENTIRAYAESGVDFISVGALTHQIKSLDLSLKAI